jgi:hypothetical protein
LVTADVGKKIPISLVVYRLRGELHATCVHPDVPSSVAGINKTNIVFEVEDRVAPSEDSDNIFLCLEQRAKTKARELGLGDIHGLTC